MNGVQRSFTGPPSPADSPHMGIAGCEVKAMPANPLTPAKHSTSESLGVAKDVKDGGRLTIFKGRFTTSKMLTLFQ